MEIRVLSTESEIAMAAGLAADRHAVLRKRLPFLPPRSADYFRPKLAWMAREGLVLGLFDEAGLAAFYGDFVIENFRNVGQGAYSPEWSHGHREGDDAAFAFYRILYREMARRRLNAGVNVHAVSVYTTETTSIESFAKTGFGCIVMDAAQATPTLAACLRPDTDDGFDLKLTTARVRRAIPGDAATLERLNARLAAHIGDAPVSMPDTQGNDAAWWADWLTDGGHLALLAEIGGRATGYIKAEAPQFDVSDAVHDPLDLGIDGLFVEPESRGRGIARSLLRSLVDIAARGGKTLVSVDCETTNLEAYAFWTRYFEPVAWSLERRI